MYAQFADWCRTSVPAPDTRVYSIEWIHDGDEWIATVGENLRGRRELTKHRRGQPIVTSSPLSDAALVLAIFPGNPYLVVTDAHPLGAAPSAWVNPLMAGMPKAVQLFRR